MNSLKPLIFTLLGIAVFVALGFTGVSYLLKRKSEWGFKDAVRNPQEFSENFEEQQRRMNEAIAESKKWSDAKVAEETRKFVLGGKVSNGEGWQEKRVLRELGTRTHPAVLDLLRDKSLRARMTVARTVGFFTEAPINRACDLLGDAPPAETIELLGPFLDSPSGDIRRDVIAVIMKTGGATMVPYFRRALGDSDNMVQHYALSGLVEALKESSVADDVREQLYPDVMKQVSNAENGRIAAEALLRLDRKRAGEHYLSEEVFNAQSPVIFHALNAFVVCEVVVPRERLLALIAAFEAGEVKEARADALGRALVLLGDHHLPEDREFLRARLKHQERSVAGSAAEALISSHGLKGFDNRMWDREQKIGYDKLPVAARQWLAVWECDAEINNGGFSQYFFNSSGDHWRDALSGFEAMGAKEMHELLKGTLAVFGPEGPSPDRDTRQDQLSRIEDKNVEAFSKFDDRYYDSEDRFDVLSAIFVLEHEADFK